MDDLDYSPEERNFDLAMEDYNKYLQLQEKIKQIGVITRDDLVPFEKYLPPSVSLESFDYLPSKTNVELMVSMEAGNGIIATIIASIIAFIVGMVVMLSGGSAGGGGKGAGSIVEKSAKRDSEIRSKGLVDPKKESPKMDQTFRENVFDQYHKINLLCSVGYAPIIPFFKLYKPISESIGHISDRYCEQLKKEVNVTDRKNRIDVELFKSMITVLNTLLHDEHLPVDSSFISNLNKSVEDEKEWFEIIKAAVNYYRSNLVKWSNEIQNQTVYYTKFPGTKEYYHHFQNNTQSLNIYLDQNKIVTLLLDESLISKINNIKKDLDAIAKAVSHTYFKNYDLVYKVNQLKEILEAYEFYLRIASLLSKKSEQIFFRAVRFAEFYRGYLWL